MNRPTMSAWYGAGGEEVIDMRHYLLVLDSDLFALDDKLDLEPITY